MEQNFLWKYLAVGRYFRFGFFQTCLVFVKDMLCNVIIIHRMELETSRYSIQIRNSDSDL